MPAPPPDASAPSVVSAAPAAEAPAPSPAPAALARARRRGMQPGLVAAWVVAAIGLTVSLLLWQKVDGMQQQLARQSAEAGSKSVEARTLARGPRPRCATPPPRWRCWRAGWPT